MLTQQGSAAELLAWHRCLWSLLQLLLLLLPLHCSRDDTSVETLTFGTFTACMPRCIQYYVPVRPVC